MSARPQGWDGAAPGIAVVRIKVGGRLANFAAADIDVKPLFVRKPLIRAQVPLADMTGCVSGRLEHFGDRNLIQFHPIGIRRAEKPAVSPPYVFYRVFPRTDGRVGLAVQVVDPVGHTDTEGIPARHDGSPGRRADRARGIAVRKFHPLRGKPVDVRCFIIAAPEAGDIGPS